MYKTNWNIAQYPVVNSIISKWIHDALLKCVGYELKLGKVKVWEGDVPSSDESEDTEESSRVREPSELIIYTNHPDLMLGYWKTLPDKYAEELEDYFDSDFKITIKQISGFVSQ